MAVFSKSLGKPPGGPEPGSPSDSALVPASPGYSIELVTSEDGLARLQEDWNRLSEAAESPNVYTTFDWFRAWHWRFAREPAGGRRRPEVLVLKRNGVVAGISPLTHRAASRFGFVVRKLEFPLSPADYNDLVLGDDPAGQTEAVVDYLARTQDQWDLVDLRNVRGAGSSAALIESALSRTSFLHRILPEARCPYFPIDANWFGMVNRFSRSSRRTLRNQQYRLERMRAEGLCVRIIENPQDESGLLDKLIVLDIQKRIRGQLVPPFIAAHRDVFQSLFDTLGPRGWFYVALMELGERPLAWQIGFRCGRKLWDFATAYDHSFSRLSPGTMLLPAVLDFGFSHGYEEYDFLQGEEPYKMRWSTGCHERFRLLAWSPRWTSRTRAFLYLDLKEALHRWFGTSRRL